MVTRLASPRWLGSVAEDAVRSETVSPAVLPAICDLQGDLHKVQGEADPLSVKFRNGSKML
jgi:hypothetical protein